jgi:hypothetical protein
MTSALRKVLVGIGLVTMLSAVAFFSVVANDSEIPVSVVNGAAVTAFWGFLFGTALAVCGGLQRARR